MLDALATLLGHYAATRDLAVHPGDPITLRRGGLVVATLTPSGRYVTVEKPERDFRWPYLPLEALAESLAWDARFGADPARCPACAAVGDHLRATRAWAHHPPVARYSTERAGAREGRWACDACLASGLALEADPSAQVLLEYGIPRVAYVARAFPCRVCDAPFVFAPEAQRDAYETHGLYINKRPLRCPPCRATKTAYARAQLGLVEALHAQDARTPEGLVVIARAYARLGLPARALEYARRARNLARGDAQRAAIEAATAAITTARGA